MTKSTAGIAVDRRTLVSGMAAVSALGAVLPTATQAQTTTSQRRIFVRGLRRFAAHDVPALQRWHVRIWSRCLSKCLAW